MKSTETIFVVFGTTGEYSDRNEWPVRAFSDEAIEREIIYLWESRRIKRERACEELEC